MKMLMIICPEERQKEIRELIGAHEVHAYTELREVIGEGAHGKRLDTRVWPTRSVLVFTVVAEEKVDELMQALAACRERLLPSEGMRAFVLPVEQML